MSDISTSYYERWRENLPPKKQSALLPQLLFHESLIQEGIEAVDSPSLRPHWYHIRFALNELLGYSHEIAPYCGHPVTMVLFADKSQRTQAACHEHLQLALKGLHNELNTTEGQQFLSALTALDNAVENDFQQLTQPSGTESDEEIHVATVCDLIERRARALQFFGQFPVFNNATVQEEISKIASFALVQAARLRRDASDPAPPLQTQYPTNETADKSVEALRSLMELTHGSHLEMLLYIQETVPTELTLIPLETTVATKLPCARQLPSGTVYLAEHYIYQLDQQFFQAYESNPSVNLLSRWVSMRMSLRGAITSGDLSQYSLNSPTSQAATLSREEVAAEVTGLAKTYGSHRCEGETRRFSQLLQQLGRVEPAALYRPVGENTDPQAHWKFFIEELETELKAIQLIQPLVRQHYPRPADQAEIGGILLRSKRRFTEAIAKLRTNSPDGLETILNLAKEFYEVVNPDSNKLFGKQRIGAIDQNVNFVVDLLRSQNMVVKRLGTRLLQLAGQMTFDPDKASEIVQRAVLLNGIIKRMLIEVDKLHDKCVFPNRFDVVVELTDAVVNAQATLKKLLGDLNAHRTTRQLNTLHTDTYVLAIDLRARCAILNNLRDRAPQKYGAAGDLVALFIRPVIDKLTTATDLLITGFDDELLNYEALIEKEEPVEETLGPQAAAVEPIELVPAKVDLIDEVLGRPNFNQLHMSLRLAKECRRLAPSEDAVDTILDTAREIFEAALGSVEHVKTHNLSELYEAVLASGKCTDAQLTAVRQAHTAILRLSFANSAINYGRHRSTLNSSQDFARDLQLLRQEKDVERAKGAYLDVAIHLAQAIVPKGDTTPSSPISAPQKPTQATDHQQLISNCLSLIPLKLTARGPNQTKRALTLHHLMHLLRRLGTKLATDPTEFPLYHQHHGMLLAARSLQMALVAQLLTKPLTPDAKSQKGHSLDFEDDLVRLARASNLKLDPPKWLVRALPILKHPHLNPKKQHEVALAVAAIEEASQNGTQLPPNVAHSYLEKMLKLTYDVLATT